VRDFTYDEGALEKQRREIAALEVEEKELWVSAARLNVQACPLFARMTRPKPHCASSTVACASHRDLHSLPTPSPLSPLPAPAHPQTDLLKLTRINFSESYQLLAHLKTVRLFVESVLRYGLPAEYAGVVVRPEPKTAGRTLKALQEHFGYLAAASQAPSRRAGGAGKGKEGQAGAAAGLDEVGGEWAGVMEAEYFDFVLFEVPIVPV
jgi:hypothetical protein